MRSVVRFLFLSSIPKELSICKTGGTENKLFLAEPAQNYDYIVEKTLKMKRRMILKAGARLL